MASYGFVRGTYSLPLHFYELVGSDYFLEDSNYYWPEYPANVANKL